MADERKSGASVGQDEMRLCYVDGEWAYFARKAPTEMWGDDWNDVPYEHNAGNPYDWEVRVAFISALVPPCDGHRNSEWSVEDINRGAVPWLKPPAWWTGPRVDIMAGTTLAEFRRLIAETGGEVYERVPAAEGGAVSNEIAIPEEGVPEHLWLRVGPAYVVALRAELDAVRAERDAVRAERDEAEARGRADERAAVVAWLRDDSDPNDPPGDAAYAIANSIERGEHVQRAKR